MGLDDDASMEHAKKAYRARAVLLHPDRVEGQLRSDAERAMAQLNEAWETVRLGFERGARDGAEVPQADTRAAASRGTWPTSGNPRPPTWGECDMCGCAPARPLAQYRITGALIFWRSSLGALDLCQVCANSFYVESQAHCLTKGWWGIFAFPATFIVAIVNWRAVRRHRNMVGPPSARDARVVTPFSRPVGTTPLRRRPLPIAASVAAIGLASWLILATQSPSSSGPSPSPASGVGTCLDEDGFTTDCSASDAAYKLIYETSDPSTCSAEAFRDAQSETSYCAVRLP